MRRTRRPTRFSRHASASIGALALLSAAACGSANDSSASPSDPSSGSSASASTSDAPATADTSAGEGDWLLGMTTAGGADGEDSTFTYITYNPSTGQASAKKLPAYKAPSTEPDQAALLVSADRKWALTDTSIPRAQENSGQLKMYSLATGAAKTLDIRKATGDSGLHALGWAFDPQDAAVLRVVDSKSRVWDVDVAKGTAKQSGTLTKGAWIFTNGFNHNTGEPYVESIESDATRPAGNGVADKSNVMRAGGTLLANGSAAMSALPKSPCRLAGGFTDSTGTSWEFCADSSTIKTYVLAKGGTEWTAYGKPSTAVAPIAASFPLALPPAN